MSFGESCIFCKIVRKQAPASIIYEDETVMAFLDIRPLNEGHTLVIPKKHYVDIFDIPEDQLSKVHKVAKQVSTAVKLPSFSALKEVDRAKLEGMAKKIKQQLKT